MKSVSCTQPINYDVQFSVTAALNVTLQMGAKVTGKRMTTWESFVDTWRDWVFGDFHQSLQPSARDIPRFDHDSFF